MSGNVQAQVWEDPQRRPEDLVFCHKCRAPAWRQDKYCSKCGSRLDQKKKNTKQKPVVQKANLFVILLVMGAIVFWAKVFGYFFLK